MPLPTPGEPAVEVIVQLAASAGGARALRTVEERTRLRLERLHPDTVDPELAKFATTRVARSSVESVIDLLMACAGVEAAYVKPGDALP